MHHLSANYQLHIAEQYALTQHNGQIIIDRLEQRESQMRASTMGYNYIYIYIYI